MAFYHREEKVDRKKTTPFLLRVYTKTGGHHLPDDYQKNKEPADGILIYTWKDATLKELTDRIKGVRPAARRQNAKLSFALVYPDKTGKPVVRQVGQTFSTRRSEDEKRTLASLKFEIGDFLDVAIY